MNGILGCDDYADEATNEETNGDQVIGRPAWTRRRRKLFANQHEDWQAGRDASTSGEAARRGLRAASLRRYEVLSAREVREQIPRDG